MNWGELINEMNLEAQPIVRTNKMTEDKQYSLDPSTVDLWAGQALREFSNLSKCIKARKEISLTSGTNSYTLPDGIINIHSTWTDHSGTYKEVTELNDSFVGESFNNNATPLKFCNYGLETNKVYLFGTPTEAGKKLYLHATVVATVPTSPTAAIGIPAEYEMALVYYFMFKVLTFASGWNPNYATMAGNYFDLFKGMADKARIEIDWKGKNNYAFLPDRRG